jgi:hypothetical protein
MRRRSILTLACSAVLATATLAAAAGRLPADLEMRGWEEITFDGKTPNAYASCGADCVEIATMQSVSMIGREVAVDLKAMPILSWEWKVERPVAATDLATKGEDDRAVALYVTFPYDPDTSSFAENLMRPMVELARGSDAPGRVISYVWGGFGEPGQVVESPFFGSANAMIVGRNASAQPGVWLPERVDVAADHERIFGHPPSKAAHILLSADSDDTKADNRAFVRHIMFGAR